MSRWCVWPLLSLIACAHTRQLDQQVRSLRDLTQRAREQGAYNCAPEELALSDAHVHFAAIELAEGDPARAREHLVLANANGRAALRLSADGACSKKASPRAVEARAPARERSVVEARTPARERSAVEARTPVRERSVVEARAGARERADVEAQLSPSEELPRPRDPLSAHTDRDRRGLSNDAPERRRRSSRKHAEI